MRKPYLLLVIVLAVFFVAIAALLVHRHLRHAEYQQGFHRVWNAYRKAASSRDATAEAYTAKQAVFINASLDFASLPRHGSSTELVRELDEDLKLHECSEALAEYREMRRPLNVEQESLREKLDQAIQKCVEYGGSHP